MADAQELRRAYSGIHLYAAGPGVTAIATPDTEWRQEAGYGTPFPVAGAAETLVLLLGVQDRSFEMTAKPRSFTMYAADRSFVMKTKPARVGR